MVGRPCRGRQRPLRRRAGHRFDYTGGRDFTIAQGRRILMAKLTRAQREWRPGMKKKQRSTKMMFASTVLVCEALLAVFVTLAAFGLKRGGEPVVVLSLGAAV